MNLKKNRKILAYPALDFYLAGSIHGVGKSAGMRGPNGKMQPRTANTASLPVQKMEGAAPRGVISSGHTKRASLANVNAL